MEVKKVLFIASEAEPYAKSGGLADVVSALPKALRKEGVEVKIIIPLYSSVNYEKFGIKRVLESACVHMGPYEEWFSVHHTDKPHNIDVYFIESNKFFSRNGYYHDQNGSFADNLQRFSFFTRAAMQAAKDLGFKPDIVHVHDWQTSLAAYYMAKGVDPFFYDSRSVLTIHNMGYQGSFGTYGMDYAMIDPSDFTSDKFESYGGINLMKAGIKYADKISTVSPTYAEEIAGPIGGCGLHEYIRKRRADMYGITNGVDLDEWNPGKDKHIPASYGKDSYISGKKAAKKALQERFWLDKVDNVPLLAVISRFADQKGLNLLRYIISSVLDNMICQIVVIGSGDKELESFFGNLPKYHSGRMGSFIGYNNELAHLAEAGADFFIMPSLYEPCGLNQMYSQIYGTLPVARATGGLADTIEQYNEFSGKGTGFLFYDIDPTALYYTIGWAVSTYYDRPSHMKNMIERAMEKDFSWKKAAGEYIDMYEKALLYGKQS